MAYEKRLCILKQIKKGFSADGGVLSGAVYGERMGGDLIITPRILGIAPVKEGSYALAIGVEGKIFLLELKGNTPLTVHDSPSIKAGFSALLVFLKGDASPLAFGSCGAAPADYAPLLSAFSGTGKKQEVPPPPPPEEFPLPFTPNAPVVPPSKESDPPPFREHAAAKYDDEAIAEADDYRGDEDDGAQTPRDEEEGAPKDGNAPRGNDGDGFLRPRGTLTYYYSVRERLERAFASFPRDERLKAAGALLGVIYEEGLPKYLCVAVEKGKEPPAEMKGKCCFVPATPFSDMEGFYVVFQSADSGEYVTVSES